MSGEPATESRKTYLSQINIVPDKPPQKKDVKAIHLSYGSYLSDDFVGILDEIEKSDINTIVFEVKTPSGLVAFNSQKHIDILKELLPKLKEGGIYTIARMVIFQDPVLAEENPGLAIKNSATGGPWSDNNGIVWTDPTQREVWDHNINIARQALDTGFDEVNFDYIRFPTDGNLSLTKYKNLNTFNSKGDAIASFLDYTRKKLGPSPTLSIDVFGMTFVGDQHTIGQIIGMMAPHVDVIYPMSYPSHYPDGFMGFENPAEHPYEIVDSTLERGLEKLEGHAVVVRPWVQDFDLGAEYEVNKIQAQIRAIEDNGIDTWALWNASNRYTFEAVR